MRNTAEHFYDEVMGVMSSYERDGKNLRQHLKDGFEKYLTRNQGKVPHNGVPFEEFLTWLPLIHEEKRDEKFYQMMRDIFALFFWDYSRIKINIPEELNEHVMQSDAPKVIPVEILRRFPHWTQWISLNALFSAQNGSNDQAMVEGAFVSFLTEGNKNFLYCIVEYTIIDLVAGTRDNSAWVSFKLDLDQDFGLREDKTYAPVTSLNATSLEVLDNHRRIIEMTQEHLIKSLLFVASMEPADSSESKFSRPAPRRKGRSYKLQTKGVSKEVTIGQEYLEIIREFNETVNREGGSRKAHIRCAHWHRYWTGAKAIQKLILKWIAPCIVSGTSEESNGK